MKKDSLLVNIITLIGYYFLFYTPFIFQLGTYLHPNEISVMLILLVYLIIPLLIWFKFLFLSQKPNFLNLFALTSLLALPFFHTFRLGLFFMAHIELSISLIIRALPFGSLLAIAFGIFSIAIKFIQLKFSK